MLIRGAAAGSSRMRSARRIAVAICAALPIVNGCFGTTGHLAVVTTRDLPADVLLVDKPAQHVIGKNCIQLIVVFPTRMPNFGEAIAQALEQSGGSVLTNVRIGYELLYFPFVYGRACYVAEGDAR